MPNKASRYMHDTATTNVGDSAGTQPKSISSIGSAVVFHQPGQGGDQQGPQHKQSEGEQRHAPDQGAAVPDGQQREVQNHPPQPKQGQEPLREQGLVHGGLGCWRTAAQRASFCQVSTTESGFSEMELMPSSRSHRAKSGWSLGPWPQIPMYLSWARQALMAWLIRAVTAGSRSSKSWASSSRPESRSRPRVSWVRSFEPMDMPSKNSRNCSARMALLGTSHIMIRRRPSVPPAAARLRPRSASMATTRSAWRTVRTKGTMISTLVRPMSLRTRFRASHSIAKASEN